MSYESHLHLRLLGLPTWHFEGRSGVLHERLALVLACVGAAGRIASDELYVRVWPGDRARARDNLKHIEPDLRKITGHLVTLVREGSFVTLSPGVDCDLWRDPATADAAALLACGSFLQGIEAPAGGALSRWLGDQRRSFHERIGRALIVHAERLLGVEPVVARTFADRASELAPWLEAAWCAKAQAAYATGDVAAAAKACDDMENHLRGAPLSAHASMLKELLGRRPAARIPASPTLNSAGDDTTRRPSSIDHPPRLIARASHLDAMEAAWRSARPFLLLGEPGAGKSRLLDDFIAAHGEAVVVQAHDGDDRSAYATLIRLLRETLLRKTPALDAFMLSELGRVMPEFGNGSDRGPADQSALWRAAERLLERAAQRGLQAIVVDDLHFADPASVEALRRIASGPARESLPFGLASRPLSAGPIHALLDDWLAEMHCPACIAVEPFALDEVRAFLPSLQLGGAAARVTAERLHAHVGGNPFLLLQTLRELARGGLQGDALPLPAQAQRQMQRRLASLPEHLRDVLQLAAVLDADFSAARAASATGRTARETGEIVAELESLGILRNGRFVHDLLRQSALSTVGGATLRALHAQAATVLTLTPAPRARVAAHWDTALQWPEAAAAYLAAGREGRDAGRPLESIALFEKAAACFDEAGDRGGQFDAVHELLEEALMREEEAAPALIARLDGIACTDEHRARVAIGRAQIGVRAHGDPSLLGQTTLALALAQPFEKWLPDALQAHGLALAQAGRIDEADVATTRAEELARRSGRLRKALLIRTDLVYARWQAARYGDAIVMARDLIGQFRGLGDDTSARRVEGNLAVLLLGAGDPHGALALAGAAHEYHCEIRSTPTSSLPAVVAVVLCSALAHFGRFREALDVLRPTWDAWPIRTSDLVQAKVGVTLANVWLLLGCDAEAEAVLDSTPPNLPSLEVQWCLAHARIAALRGRPRALLLDRIGALQKAHWEGQLSHVSWLDWSHQGDAREVAAQMARVQQAYAESGMPGTARSAAIRAAARLNEIDAPWAIEAAYASACEAAPGLQLGAHPSTYLPEAWHIAARACSRAGDEARAGEYLHLARSSIAEALALLPEEEHDRFLQRNPVNRAICGSASAGNHPLRSGRPRVAAAPTLSAARRPAAT